MNALSKLVTTDDIAGETDSVGGSGGPVPSGLYTSTITLAYLITAKSEALGLVLHAKTEAGQEIRQTVWMTSGKEKGGKNYYEKDGKKTYLPGFLMANSIALLTCGKEIGELGTEEKVVKLYSYDAKAEVPTKVQVFTDLIGKEIILGVIKQTVNKNVKNDAGMYVASGETRDENELDKAFRASDRKTTAEIRAESEAVFIDKWADKWTDVTRNRTKDIAPGGGKPGAPAVKPGAPGAGKPKSSLFGS